VAGALVLVRNDVTHDARVLREARVLHDMGYDVLVAGVVSQEERQTELELEGIRVIRLVGPLQWVRRLLRLSSRTHVVQNPAPSDSGHRGMATGEHRLRRVLITAAFNLQGAALAWRVAPELVHANDYDTMWIGVTAKLLRGSRLVYDAHELWPDQGLAGWRPWLVGCEWLFTRLADAMVAANPAISETIAQRYRVEPPVVVRNVPAYPAKSPGPPEGLRAEKQPLAFYIGSLAPERGIEQAIEALARVPEVRLRFMGSGSDEYRAHLDRSAGEAGVADRIEYRQPVEPSAVPDTIAAGDMGIVLTQATCLNNMLSLPNKLFEYAAAGLPIIASDLPLLGPLVRDEGIGEVVPPADVEAIAAAMRRLADPARNAEVRDRVRSFGERVTWQQERQLLEAVYAGLPKQGAPSRDGRPLTILAVGAGSSPHVARFAQRFSTRGHRVFLFSDSPNPSGVDGVTQLVPPNPADRRWFRLLPRPFRGGLYHSLCAMELLRALRTHRPDVVHVYYAYSYYAWVAGVLGSRPLVVTTMGGDVLFDEQGSPGRIGMWLTARLLRQADYITTQSDFLGDVVARLGASRSRIERILWGVPPDAFRRRDASDLRLALGLDPRARIILSPKILQPFYRVHLVVEAMAIVRRSIPDAVLLVSEHAADPAYCEQIARRIEELDLTEHVMLVAQIPYEEMPSYYSLAEVSVGIPSSDSMPQALFEAMACGTPTILSRLPRYEEIVQHEESAYFVDPDPEAIAAGIVHLLDDTVLRNGIAERGRRIVVEQADLDKEVARVEKRYRELLATIRPRAFSLAALLSAGAAAARAYVAGSPAR